MALNLNEFARPLLQQAYDASGFAMPYVDLANEFVGSSWSTVVDFTGSIMSDSHYFRICVMPTGLSLVLFWLLNVPLLFFNFFPSLNPFERWKVQKGRYETFDRVVWMILTGVCGRVEYLLL